MSSIEQCVDNIFYMLCFAQQVAEDWWAGYSMEGGRCKCLLGEECRGCKQKLLVMMMTATTTTEILLMDKISWRPWTTLLSWLLMLVTRQPTRSGATNRKGGRNQIACSSKCSKCHPPSASRWSRLFNWKCRQRCDVDEYDIWWWWCNSDGNSNLFTIIYLKTGQYIQFSKNIHIFLMKKIWVCI